MSMVQQAIEVGAPLHAVYEQLAAFENYPRFMTGVHQVTPVGRDQTHWVMDVDGKRREFDARITERSLDERVSWATVEGPLLAETITLRPMGETRTQVIAQLEADIAFLLPSDRHGQASLTKRLKDDLTTFKSLVESGELGEPRAFAGASTKNLGHASPASVAARLKNRAHPGAGWGTSGAVAEELPYRGLTPGEMGTNVDITSAPGISDVHDLDDVLAPGRRIAKAGTLSGGAAGTRSPRHAAPEPAYGVAEMGGRTTHKDTWGDGMINEEDRGSAYDL